MATQQVFKGFGNESDNLSFPSVDLTGKLIIKAQLENDIRRIPIHNEDITYDELLIMMQRIFHGRLRPTDEVTLKYKDEDKDLITIADNADLTLAKQTSRILRIVLLVDGEQWPSEVHIDPDSLSAVRKNLCDIRDRVNWMLDQLSLIDRRQKMTDIPSAPPDSKLDEKPPAVSGVDAAIFDPLKPQPTTQPVESVPLQPMSQSTVPSMPRSTVPSMTPSMTPSTAPSMPHSAAMMDSFNIPSTGTSASFPINSGAVQDTQQAMNISPAQQQIQPHQQATSLPSLYPASSLPNTMSYSAEGASTQAFPQGTSGHHAQYPQQPPQQPPQSSSSYMYQQQPGLSTYQPTAYGAPSGPYTTQQQQQQPTGQAGQHSHAPTAGYNPYSRAAGQQQPAYNYYNRQQFQ